MPPCGPTFHENIPLLGGASATGAGVGHRLMGNPPRLPSSHPSHGGKFQRSSPYQRGREGKATRSPPRGCVGFPKHRTTPLRSSTTVTARRLSFRAAPFVKGECAAVASSSTMTDRFSHESHNVGCVTLSDSPPRWCVEK